MPETYKIQDILLPTDFLMESGTVVDLQINENDVDGEIWLAPDGTETFEEGSSMQRADNGQITVPQDNNEYRMYIVKDGKASDPSTGKIATQAPGGALIFWAEDMDVSNIGSAGAVSVIDLGNTQNTDENTKIFGIEQDGETLSFSHINALDNTGDAKWRGYAEKNIEREFSEGEYTLYIMCDTHSVSGANRQFEVKINNESAGVTDIIGDSVSYSTNIWLRYISCLLPLLLTSRAVISI